MMCHSNIGVLLSPTYAVVEVPGRVGISSDCGECSRNVAAGHDSARQKRYCKFNRITTISLHRSPADGGSDCSLYGCGIRRLLRACLNDEKDGRVLPAEIDLLNLKESTAATEVLGIKKVISLNWRNDYMNPIPLDELRSQIILLIRKYRPDVVVGHDPWQHYQKNPDHRNVARALAEAYWLSGYANVNPEHLKAGLKAFQASYFYGKARVDWGLGHRPNLAIELNASQVERKERAYQTHRNVYANPATARAMKAALARRDLVIPEWEGIDDQQAAVQMEDWYMEWISRQKGREAGVKYAEGIITTWMNSIIFPA